MQPAHFPDPTSDDDEIHPEQRPETTSREWRALIYNWILLAAGLGAIYAIGFWFAP